uniref:Alpha-mannosidase n=1 Tax=Plectus sambesii TaxID=2011161 RepID=A0A914V5H3_9BILA
MNCIQGFLAVAFNAALIAVVAGDGSPTCSWQNCPQTNSDQINVHMICHTHDDMGWLKTVDQYYFGAAKEITHVGVQYILSTVVQELIKNPNRRFSYCETGFFWRWITHQTDDVKQQVLTLVNNGQLEFIGGGWTQNDEAATHYITIIDQMTLGLSKLNQLYGECGKPKVAWQIDPFGHSREQASLFSQMGYDALFFARTHYLDKTARLQNKSIEFLWNTSDDLKTNLLTGSFYMDNYNPPPFFCFDEQCNDDPIIDDPTMEGYNVDLKAQLLVDFITDQAAHQRTNHLMTLMGSDFQYTNAEMWFSNLDKIMNYMQKNQSMTKINLIYSTPSCYVQSLKAANVALATKTDDFFPYAWPGPHNYWTGYFTSRPALKFFIRQSSGLLQVCKQLDTMANLGSSDYDQLDIFRKAVALAQHHDAVTGTAKQAVTYDYAKRLYQGWMQCQQVLNDALAVLVPKGSSAPVPAQKFCSLSNVTYCDVTNTTNTFTVTVFNSQAKPITTMIRVPYYGSTPPNVKDPNGAAVAAQLVKTFAPAYQLQAYLPVVAPNELVIPVNVGALGFATYFVSDQASDKSEHSEDKPEEKTAPASEPQTKAQVVLQNELIQLTFGDNGLLSQYTDLKKQLTVPLSQEILYYQGMGLGDPDRQPSGAYIFRPNGTSAYRMFSNQVTIEMITGPVVSEVRQTFSPWASQVIRLYSNKPYVEFEWTVGPIPSDDYVTKEVISRFRSNIASAQTFYTDANGRQIMKRTRNYAPMYNYVNSEPVAGNYYPVNSRIYINDGNLQMTVLNDRSQGGSSLVDGQIELMVHRRCFYDDHYGVDEPLNEPGIDGRGLVARGRHWLVLATPAESPAIHRQLAFDLFHSPVLTFAPLSMSVAQYQAAFITQFSGLQNPLPANVHLLSLEQWDSGSNLLRLEHPFQTNEDATLSQPVTVHIQNLFKTISVSSVSELMLGANRDVSSSGSFDVALNPMQIRTFKIVTPALTSTPTIPPVQTTTLLSNNTQAVTSMNTTTTPTTTTTTPTATTTQSSAALSTIQSTSLSFVFIAVGCLAARLFRI